MTRDRQQERRQGKRRSEPADEDFASRWSRMKRGARSAPAEPEPVGAPPPPDERSDEEILRELGLPDPETLKPGDDIKGFMASAVPARIRNRVLRRLWISNPVLANLDGLVDYGEDFTDAAMVPAVLQTAYKVGRGWARDAVEEEPEAATAAQDETEEDETEGEDGDAGEPGGPVAQAPEHDPEQASAGPRGDPEAEPAAGSPAEERDEPRPGPVRESRAPLAARRMRFRFADD